jgi:hypothetical protein
MAMMAHHLAKCSCVIFFSLALTSGGLAEAKESKTLSMLQQRAADLALDIGRAAQSMTETDTALLQGG